MMMAGFDTTVVLIDSWYKILVEHGLQGEPVRSDAGWVWSFREGFIVTSHNPYTGQHFNVMMVHPSDIGMLGYVGIEGHPTFVNDVFQTIKEKAEYVKDECYGSRDYI